jgi:hypothetical protein
MDQVSSVVIRAKSVAFFQKTAQFRLSPFLPVTYLLAVDKSGHSFQLRARLPEDRAEKEGTQKIKTA